MAIVDRPNQRPRLNIILGSGTPPVQMGAQGPRRLTERNEIEHRAKIGGVCIDQEYSGTLHIYQASNPSARALIFPEQIDDLTVALDTVLGRRISPPANPIAKPAAKPAYRRFA